MKILMIDNYDSFTYNLVQIVKENSKAKIDVLRNDEIKMEKNPSPAMSVLGIKPLIFDRKTIVKQIYPGSTAQLAGIMMEDQIVAINGTKVRENLDELLNCFQNTDLTISVMRMGRSVTLQCPELNKSWFPLYKLSKAKVPSNLQKRVFKNWCGYNWDDVIFE